MSIDQYTHFDELMAYTPGSSDMDFRTLRYMLRPFAHTGPTFESYWKETLDMLGKLFKTKNMILPLVGTMRISFDAIISSTVVPGDKVLNLTNGYWGDYPIDVVSRYGGVPVVLREKPGIPIDAGEVSRKLDENKNVKAVIVAHVETDGGVLNPIKEIGKVVREKSNALFIVDAATSYGVMEVDADGWGADVVFSGSHKGLAAPVGLAFLAISDRVWEIAEKRKDTIRSHYSSLITWKNEFIAPPPGKIWFSFPVPLVHAVRARLDKIFREGPENVFKRHHIAATAIRRGIKEMGIGLFTDEKYSADTHCCFVNPSGVERAKVVSTMMNRYGMVIGAPPYRPELFYVGTINDNQIRPRNIMALLTCLGLTMKHLGVQVETEKAVMAADQVLQQLGGVISRS